MVVDSKAYKKSLRASVLELQQLGKEWGMSEEEINSCIERALEEETPESGKETPVLSSRQKWIGIKGCLVLIMVAVVPLIVVTRKESLREMITNLTDQYDHPFMRRLRFAALPLHDFFDLANKDCIIENPWYTGQWDDDCYACDVTSVNLSTSEEGFVSRAIREALPVVFLGEYQRKISYEDLYQLYRENQATINMSVSSINSSSPDLQTVTDLFTQDSLTNPGKVNAEWTLRGVSGTAVTRKLFPYPDFIINRDRIANKGTLFIDGNRTDQYDLPRSTYITWYVQACNDRSIILTLSSPCSDTCDSIRVDLKEGDILMFVPTLWTVTMLPNTQGMSIGYQGFFS